MRGQHRPIRYRRGILVAVVMLTTAMLAAEAAPEAAAAAPVGVVNLALADTLGRRVAGEGFVAFTVNESAQGADLNGDGGSDDVAVWHVTRSDGVTLNLGIAGPLLDHSAKAGPGFVFAADETTAGQDFNGDGDSIDTAVYHAYSPAGGVVNLGLAAAANRTWVWEGGFLFLVDELDQAATDLNGDGDTLDAVWHAYSWTGGVTNLGLGAWLVLQNTDVSAGDGLVCWVSEVQQGGTDLNGDGDALDDFVWHSWSPAGGTTNLMLAAQGPEFESYGNGVALTVSEVEQGATDLNGDGDATDNRAWHVYRPGNGVANLALAAGNTASLSALDDGFVFTVGEPDQGGTDLNGDSDATDAGVWHVYQAGSGVTNLQLAAGPHSLRIDNGAAMQISEVDQGGTDLNGDADAVDTRVWHVYREGSGVTNLLLAADSNTSKPLGDGFVFTVSEAGQGGTDLNGDGDAADGRVIHAYLPGTGVHNSGLASLGSALTAGERTALFRVGESFQGNVDLNGDADSVDSVWHAFTPGVGPVNLGLAPGFPVGAATIDGGFLFTVDEASQGGTDLNGDADAIDNGVWHHYQSAAGITNLQIAGHFGPGSFAEIVADGVISITVDEALNGATDLNGDLDTLDDVRHVVFLCAGRIPTWLGTSGADTRPGASGSEVLNGLGGNDQIEGGGGNDVICGGWGDDVLDGGVGGDVLFGGPGDDRLRGRAGNDRLRGEGGNDLLDGGNHDDRISGGVGADVIYPGGGDDVLNGGGGIDRISYQRSPAAVQIDLGGGTATGSGSDTLSAIENADGSRYGDYLLGSVAANRMRGLDGDDRLYGMRGDDVLYGNDGDDRLDGGNGWDTAGGGAGQDRCVAEVAKLCEL